MTPFGTHLHRQAIPLGLWLGLRGGYAKVAHHAHVLVLKDVAVIQEETREPGKTSKYPNTLAWHHKHRVLPSLIHVSLLDGFPRGSSSFVD